MRSLPAIRIEGGLLGPDVLDQLLAAELPGQRPADFGLDGRRSLTDEIASAFADARALWGVFRHRLGRLPDSDPATSLTRDAWVIPFLGLLGYELRYNPRAYELDGSSFAISHRAGEPDDAPPVHIVGVRQELGRVAATGRPRLAPHSLVQEYLNRSEQLWGIVTNGLVLRLLRDSTYIRRQAYVEFDLAAILEDQHFQDFAALYRLLHRTRLPRTAAEAHECLLEQYYQHSLEQGGRVRDRLRDGVEECLKRLAHGFLRHPANLELRRRIAPDYSDPDKIKPEDLYRQLLRLVYRFLFLLVSEDRGLISPDPIYREHYGVARLRRLLDQRGVYTEDDDLWHSLRVLWKVLSDERLSSLLQVAPLNGELFAPIDLDHCAITNRELLEAFWHLAWYQETPSSPPRRVNYAALDVEELGSVYESLLDLHPVIDTTATEPRFHFAQGTERKSTGSYYTPPELVAELVRSALEPVIEERLEEAKRMANREWRMVPKEIQERFANGFVQRLPRSGSLATRHERGQTDLRADARFSPSGALRHDQPAAPGSNLDPREHRGGMGKAIQGRVHSIPPPSQWQQGGTGDPSLAERRGRPGPEDSGGTPVERTGDSGQATGQPGTKPPTQENLSKAWNETPFAIRHSLFAEYALLSLRILDPACGSGHFLLAAARRLGKELARVRTGEDEPAPERVREAVRDVVAHCIYGVDKNPLAVELCRVALWLEAHCEGKPLTFLDHRIRCGDSLVGVFDLEVLQRGIPDEAFQPVSGDDRKLASSLKRRNREEREGQRTLPFDGASEVRALGAEAQALDTIADDTPQHIREKQRRFHELQQRAAHDRRACNLWTAAFFQPLRSGQPAITSAHLADHLEGRRIDGRILGLAEAMASTQRFFHWPLEFPEVFASDGFDIVIGNPPFMGGLRISGSFGDRYRRWLEIAFAPYGGTADLCAAFYRRVFSLLRPGGRMGMVATNTIGQGDTRESGLAVILKRGGAITFARRFIKWPGAANVEVNLVAIHKPDHSPLATRSSPILDGQPVELISSRLDAEPEAEPKRLPQNEGKAFIGDYVRGIGFVLEPREAEQFLARDPRNADCLFPYLNGEDLNSDPEQKPRRWVICFHDWDLERARQYPDLLRIVEERVKPERERLRGPGDKRNREYWWQFGAYRAGMRRAIAPLRRVLVRAEVSQMHMVSFVPKDWICSHMLIVFAFDDDYHFALLQSNVHEAWVWRQASSLESRNRYTPTDCFDTFPFPPEEYRRAASGERRAEKLDGPFAEAARIGAEYHEQRRQIMLERSLGLTKTYNLFHDPNCTDADIQRLRELHAEMDRAILACYGWPDLDPQHGFHRNDRGQTRFTVSPEARRKILKRLLDLNLSLANREGAL